MSDRRKSERRQELSPPLTRELHQTFFDGIRKTLYWIVDTETTYIKIEDEKKGAEYLYEVPQGTENVLNRFNHVMAYLPEFMDREMGLGQPEGKEATL